MPAPAPLPALPECPAFGTYITVDRCQCGKETCKKGKSCFYTAEYPRKFCTDLDPAIYGPPPTGPAPSPPGVPAPPPPPPSATMCPTFGRAQGPCQCGYGSGYSTCYTFMVCNWSTLRCLYDRASNCVTNAGLCHNEMYRPIMTQNCEATCSGFVPESYASPACTDENPNCPAWQMQGFCTNTYYTQEQKRRFCSKTCGYC